VINFSNPYTYEGGNLLLTLTHSAAASGFLDFDANQAGDGIGSTLGNAFTVDATVSDGSLVDGYNYPITEFVFTTVPEPATIGLVGMPVLAAWILCRRRLPRK
jgi:hypothetical protein